MYIPTDDEDPVITCPNNVVDMSTDAGVSTAVVTWSPTPSATDNVDSLTASDISCMDGSGNSAMSGDTFNLGNTTVTCTVSDLAGNSVSCSFTIEINGKITVLCHQELLGLKLHNDEKWSMVHYYMILPLVYLPNLRD